VTKEVILPELSAPFLRFLRETKLTRATMGFQESFASHLAKPHKSENRLDAGFEVSLTQFDSLFLSLFKNAQFQTEPLSIDPQGIHDKISQVHFSRARLHSILYKAHRENGNLEITQEFAAEEATN
jgi:hypothetical protein